MLTQDMTDFLNFPLTKPEQQMYVLHNTIANKELLNVYDLYQIKGNLDCQKLTQSINILAQLHTTLRSSYDLVLSEIRRIEHPIIDYNLEVIYINNVDIPTQCTKLNKPFVLTNAPLWRFYLLIDDNNEQFLFINFHHIAGDYSSIALIMRDLLDIYNDYIPQKTFGFNDYCYNYSLVHNDLSKQSLPFWQDMYQDMPASFDFPLDYPNTDNLPYQDTISSQLIEGEILEKLKTYAKNNNSSVFTVLLLASILVAKQYTNSDDIVVGVPYSSRMSGEEKATVGMFVYTLPIRFRPNDDKVIGDFAQEVKALIKGATQNYHTSLDEMKQDSNIKLDTKIYDIVVNYLHIDEELTRQGSDISFVQYRTVVSYLNSAIAIDFNRTSKEIFADVLYSSKTMDSYFADTIAIRLVNMIKKIISSPITTTLFEFSILETTEIEQLPNQVYVSPSPKTMKEVWSNSVGRNPDSIALVASDMTYTYAQLDDVSSIIAHNLISLGVKEEDKIIILLPRDSSIIATMLGIIKSGGAFIPVDYANPTKKVQNIIEDSGAKFVITTSQNCYNYQYALSYSDISAGDCTLEASPSPNNLCYLIYTSGSTGKPKGVMIEHNGIANYVTNNVDNFYINRIVERTTTMLSITTVAFDIFLEESLVSLSNGLKLVLANEEECLNPIMLASLMERTGVDALSSTPLRITQFLKNEEFAQACRAIKVFILGGEQFPQALFNEIKELGDADIFNSYGPTEITIASNAKLLEGGAITIGKALPGVSLYVVDKHNRLLPYSAVGELLIGGVGVGRGYLNNAQLTSEKFIELFGQRLYKSGDLARWCGDEIKILGRIDSQIKLRGLRIEPGEIESVIKQFDGIQEVAVVVKEIKSESYLCAYYTSTKRIDHKKLQSYLKVILSAYMIPVYYKRLQQLPLTINGKLNHKALPKPTLVRQKKIPPQNEIQEKIFDIIAIQVGHRQFGVVNDIFSIGVTSLTAVNIVITINKLFSSKIRISDILKNRTVQEIESLLISQNIEKISEISSQYPLTYNQRDMLEVSLQNIGQIMYNIPFSVQLSSNVNPKQLKDALEKTINAHSYIKTYFTQIGENFIQNRNDNEPPQIEMYKVKDSDIQAIIDDFIQPFDLINGRLYRAKIVYSTRRTILLFDIHHSIFDGWSHNVFMTDLSVIYNGNIVDKEEWTAFDNAKLEFDTINSDDYKEILTKLDAYGSYTPSRLPSNIPTGIAEHNIVSKVFDAEPYNSFAKKHKNTPSNLFMTAVLFATSYFTDSTKVHVFDVYNGRNQDNASSLGLFLNYLPIIQSIQPSYTLSSIYKKVYKQILDYMSISYIPTLEMLKDSCNEYSIEFNYLVDECTLYNFGNESVPADLIKTKAQLYCVPVSINLIKLINGFELKVEYDNTLYSHDYINSYLNVIELSLKELIDSPNTTISKLNKKIAEFVSNI